jgi:hypothetical protein
VGHGQSVPPPKPNFCTEFPQHSAPTDDHKAINTNKNADTRAPSLAGILKKDGV